MSLIANGISKSFIATVAMITQGAAYFTASMGSTKLLRVSQLYRGLNYKPFYGRKKFYSTGPR
jgi:hypothetical protein